MILKVIDVKDPKLRLKSKEVVSFDKKLKQLISDMQETLVDQKDPEGVGLAAPQVGKNLRLFIIDYRKEKRVIINPQIISIAKKIKAPKTKNKDSILEGCLSLPHYYGPIKRAPHIKIKYQNSDGKILTEEFNGFLAQIVQHEIDHLEGILFIDRILEQKSPLYKFEGKDFEEVELL